MSKGIKFHIKTDTITEYLNTISENVDFKTPFHLRDMAELLTSDKGIEQYISHNFNRNLYKSGQDQSKWIYNKRDDGHAITITYTGMTDRVHGSDFKTWIEFSREFIEEGADETAYHIVKRKYTPYQLHLERDYAFYQETGLDEYTNPKFARHTQYVEKGVEIRHKTIINKSAGYIKNIMYNKR